MLSVVIPSLNAAPLLGAGLEALSDYSRPMEILLADGGSSDGTPTIATQYGARVIKTSPGRGAQLAAGAQQAKGDWLLFLHADTRLEKGWAEAADSFMRTPAHGQRAAYFRFALDDDSSQARRMERLVAWRARRLGLPYGDQGLLIGRDFYEQVGRYAPLPLMEDVDLARRIGRRRLVGLAARAVTSAGRYRREGYRTRSLRNLTLLGLYYLGLPPRWLARLYG